MTLQIHESTPPWEEDLPTAPVTNACLRDRVLVPLVSLSHRLKPLQYVIE